MARLLPGVLCLLLLPAGASASDRPIPELLHDPEVQYPADGCFSQDHVCEATLSFVILPSGAVSEVGVVRSSRRRECDLVLRRSLSGRVYAKGSEKLHREEHLVGYQCIGGRPLMRDEERLDGR